MSIAHVPKLTNRELEVARYYASGLSYKAIANKIGRSPSTVRNHLTSIYQKLEVTNKVELHLAISGGANSDIHSQSIQSGNGAIEHIDLDAASFKNKVDEVPLVEIFASEINLESRNTAQLIDGLINDTATTLGRFSSITVQRRTSSDKIRKDKPDFVLECGIRTNGAVLRVDAQLYSNALRRQIWSEYFDQTEIEDAKIDDMIVRKIGCRTSSAIEMAEIERGRAIAGTTLTSYEKALKSRAFAYDAARLASRALLDQSISTTSEVLLESPRNIHALWTACLARLYRHMYRWEDDPGQALDEARDLIEQLLYIDGNNSRGYLLRAWVYFYMQRYPLALADHEKALALNPNLAANLFAMSWTEAVSGHLDQAREHALLGLELNPRENNIWIGEGYAALALVCFLEEEFEDCIKWGHLAYQRQPVLQLLMAAAHSRNGDQAAARQHADILLEIAPAFFQQVHDGEIQVCNSGEHSDALREGLISAIDSQ